MGNFISKEFFDEDAAIVARKLLGKVLRHRYQNCWLAVQIVETEAYYKREKSSHSSLGYTHARRAMFAPAGTIYMYYARGGDSLNFSCRGEGNAVLIKGGVPFFDRQSPRAHCLPLMQENNPLNGQVRPERKLCSGQTLLCKSLSLKVPDWNDRLLDPERLRLESVGHEPVEIIQCPRLGIPPGRDAHLMLRFVDAQHVSSATANPLRQRHYRINLPARG